jgi:hypothetical protein
MPNDEAPASAFKAAAYASRAGNEDLQQEIMEQLADAKLRFEGAFGHCELRDPQRWNDVPPPPAA